MIKKLTISMLMVFGFCDVYAMDEKVATKSEIGSDSENPFQGLAENYFDSEEDGKEEYMDFASFLKEIKKKYEDQEKETLKFFTPFKDHCNSMLALSKEQAKYVQQDELVQNIFKGALELLKKDKEEILVNPVELYAHVNTIQKVSTKIISELVGADGISEQVEQKAKVLLADVTILKERLSPLKSQYKEMSNRKSEELPLKLMVAPQMLGLTLTQQAGPEGSEECFVQ